MSQPEAGAFPSTAVPRKGHKNDILADGFIHLAPRTHDSSLAGEHIPSISYLAEDLHNSIQAVWPKRHDSRYTSVRVLLLSWVDDDLGVSAELLNLKNVFEDLYHFEVEDYRIPDKKPDKALKRRMLEFLDEDGEEALLILYYGGHAKKSIQSNEAPIWFANRQPKSASLPSGGIQSLMEEADSDVLLLYDCCNSAATSTSQPQQDQKGMTEVIAACGYEAVAPEVGEHSFTNALVETLADASKGVPYSVGELHNRLMNRLKCWVPSVTKDNNGKIKEDIWGRLEYERQPRRTPIYSILCESKPRRSILLKPLLSSRPAVGPGAATNLSTSAPGQSSTIKGNSNAFNAIGKRKRSTEEEGEKYSQVILSVQLSGSTLDISAWKECIRMFPAEARNIKIEGIYDSFSTLVLLRLPVAVWNLLPKNPAYSFVGFVTSGNQVTGELQKELGLEVTINDVAQEHEKRDEERTSKRKVELIDITEKRGKYGDFADQPVSNLTSDSSQLMENARRFDEYPLILRRCLDHEDNVLDTILEIQSPFIQNALKIIWKDTGYLNPNAPLFKIRKPYEVLFHYRHELRDYAASKERTEEEQMHMKLLVSFIEMNFRAIEKEYEQLASKNMIKFSLLWVLFRDEDIIIDQGDLYRQASRVLSSKFVFEKNRAFYEIECWNWGYNGTHFGPSYQTLRIDEFIGAKKIFAIGVYPFRTLWVKDQEDIRAEFITRGRAWRSLVRSAVRVAEYEGPTWVETSLRKANVMSELVVQHFRGRIIIDRESYQQDNPSFTTRLIGVGSTSVSSTYAFTEPIKLFEYPYGTLNTEECHINDDYYWMTDDQAFLSPAIIPGFALVTKMWGFFLLSNIRPVEWQSKAFDQLVLNDNTKTMITSMVKILEKGSRRIDVIEGKGDGMIFLLHGPPGTGKTLTAESVSELVMRPLYRLTASDFVMDVANAERSLRRTLNLVTRWNAVLLLDVADVFLSKITQDSLNRSSFVSVLLRTLEYYQGVLFLTTNQVTDLDPAFESRIHLAVKYKSLSVEQRTIIWRGLLSNFEEARAWSDEFYDSIGKELVLNGREIRNLIKISCAVLSDRELRLTERDFYRCLKEVWSAMGTAR